ncbi:MAG TPA: hypothetical protein ENI23_13450 [bacterium]|nr:hypothetical protein [bacterium]
MPINCVGIELEKVRATIKFGGVEVKTPFVKSYTINRSRTRPTVTFGASIEIRAGTTFVPGTDLEIFAGLQNDEKLRFTGMIRTITTSPSPDKAGYWMLNMQGADRFIELENKKFSRRLKGKGFSMFASIDGGPENRPSVGFSTDKTMRGGKHTYVSSTPKPDTPDHSKVNHMPKRGQGKHGNYGKISNVPGSQDADGTNPNLHDHSALSKGGPSFGVFSTS